MSLRPRPAVERMAPYKPPADGRLGKLRLDFNENTVGASPAVVAALQRAVTAENLTVYPEYSEARPKLARYFGVSPDEMLLSNGTDEAIQVLVNTFVDDGEEVVVLHPSYAMYRFYSEVAGAAVREIGYQPGTLEFPLAEVLAAKARAILISNPNNPTGTGISREVIQQILETHPETVVLIDEAYFEFSGVTVLDWIRRYSNLFVSRTFSKVYGFAAMRMGCLFSSAENMAWMRKAQSPYSVNALAVVAAAAAVDDVGYIRQYAAEAIAARADLQSGLAALGIRAFPSAANFVLFEAGARAIEVRDRLRDAGVLVRDRSYEIAGCVRVTAGTRAQAARFLEELQKVW